MSITRRHLIQASLAWMPAAHATALFTQAPDVMQLLAQKVVPVLPSAVCESSLQTLSQQIGPLSGMQDEAVRTALQLLHADDVAHARVHDVHGMTFSHTQIGILTSLMHTRGALS